MPARPGSSGPAPRVALEIQRGDGALTFLPLAWPITPPRYTRTRSLAARCAAPPVRERALRNAAILSGGSAATYIELSRYYERIGRLNEAEAALRRAVRADRRRAGTHDDLGRLLERTGRPDEAEVCYRDALAADPGHVTAAINLGALLVRAGREPEVEDVYRRSIAARPDAAVYAKLSGLLDRHGDAAGAEAEIRAAIRLASRSPDHFRQLADLLEKSGRVAEAVAARTHARDPRR